MYIEDKYDVAQVVTLFQSGDLAAQKAYILSACPPTPMRERVLNYINPDRILTSLMLLSETYCRGIDCQLGIALGQASYQLSQLDFDTISKRLKATNKAIEHTKELQDLEDRIALIQYNAANSADSCIVGFQSLGQHRQLIKFVSDAREWFKSQGYQAPVPKLILAQIDSSIELAKYKDAQDLLDLTDWVKLLPEEHFDEHRKKQLLEQKLILEQKLTERIQSAVILPSEPLKDEKTINKYREQMINAINLLVNDSFFKYWILSAFLAPLLNKLKEVLEQNMKPESLHDWATQSLPIIDRITKGISGGGKEFNQLKNRMHILNAGAIFTDTKKGRNKKKINQSIPILIQARDWAKEHNCKENENDALWNLYLCYSRTQREPQAIEVLQELRNNLEDMRESITEPMKRAGIMHKFPHLFGVLCQLLCRSNRAIELLDAIEGAKGRVLADVLTEKQSQQTSEKLFSEPAKQLPALMKQVNAHYLSYFVDDEATYAVLVTKDGSLHTQEIPIGKKQIQKWLDYTKKEYDPLYPLNWGNTISRQKKVINLSESLAPLVSWLEPLATSGIIQKNDHICYCPDEELHLIPLHYLPFRGKPLVNYVSLSRIQGALTLVHLLKRKPFKPTQFTVVQVWAKSDLGRNGSDEKIAAFKQPGAWLNKQLTGSSQFCTLDLLRGTETFAMSLLWVMLFQKCYTPKSTGKIVSETSADLSTVANLNFSQKIVHFATHGVFPLLREQDQSKNNPYLSSGLLLAKNGQLPSNSEEISEGADLSPQEVIERELDFSGSHITLQACVSGRAKEGIGGDALGLEWAFLLNGGSSLLASHWNVHAEWAAKFSIEFYEKWLIEKTSRAVAWRQTVLELMEESAQPYYWAGFSLSGDWR